VWNPEFKLQYHKKEKKKKEEGGGGGKKGLVKSLLIPDSV
jgi:hypothetical protein